jgi:hypothetical protein
MKLRIKGNTIRFRVTQSEVARLGRGQALRDATEFGPAQRLDWILEPATGNAMQASFNGTTVSVRLPDHEIRTWAGSDTVGIYGQAGALEISVEKDFHCLHRADAPEEADAFPNPLEGSKC